MLGLDPPDGSASGMSGDAHFGDAAAGEPFGKPVARVWVDLSNGQDFIFKVGPELSPS